MQIFRSFLKSLGASLIMGAVVLAICLQGEWEKTGASVEKVGLLSVAMLVAIFVYAGASHFFGSEELKLAVEGIKKKFKLANR